MRKLMISLMAAGAALVVATPAAAQYYPAPQPYGYGYNGYNGYNNGFSQVRSLQFRIDAIERQINMLDRRDRIRDRTADRLRDEANSIEHRLHRAGRNGLNPYEAQDISIRIQRLEQRVRYSLASSERGWNGYNGNGYYDRDRDGRDDRYEDDHGYRHDD